MVKNHFLTLAFILSLTQSVEAIQITNDILDDENQSRTIGITIMYQKYGLDGEYEYGLQDKQVNFKETVSEDISAFIQKQQQLNRGYFASIYLKDDTGFGPGGNTVRIENPGNDDQLSVFVEKQTDGFYKLRYRSITH